MSIRWGFILTALVVASSGSAQQSTLRAGCNNGWYGWGGTRGHACEVRELTLPAAGRLTVDGDTNGGISIKGEDRRDLNVRAVVHAWAANDTEAERIANEVVVRSDGTLRAEGPDQNGRTGWSVSYEILAPRAIDLSLETHNGGIEIMDVRGDLTFEALNGGISLDGVAGNVRGRTTNGGVTATLTGKKWDGAGLDIETTNGGVRLRVPEDYSAQLEASTVNGGLDLDFPVTVRGRIGREISTTLGGGGAPVRAATTNGQVRVTRVGAGLTRLK
jgi:hypothetical protein